jgi:hypothetical protein
LLALFNLAVAEQQHRREGEFAHTVALASCASALPLLSPPSPKLMFYNFLNLSVITIICQEFDTVPVSQTVNVVPNIIIYPVDIAHLLVVAQSVVTSQAG